MTQPPAVRVACFDALNVLAGRLRRHIEEVGARSDLTGPQVRVLLALSEPARMQVVAAAAACGPSPVTGVAVQLEAKGLVSREIDPADRRARSLVLTRQGRRLRERLVRDLVAEAPVLSNLDNAGAAALLALLESALTRGVGSGLAAGRDSGIDRAC